MRPPDEVLPEGWSIRFSQEGGVHGMLRRAELFLGADLRCRVSLTAGDAPQAEAERRLFELALQWIRDYETRTAEHCQVDGEGTADP